MSLSDCEKCWNTPCTCGHDYKDWPVEELDDLIETLKRVRLEKKVAVIEEVRKEIFDDNYLMEFLADNSSRIREHDRSCGDAMEAAAARIRDKLQALDDMVGYLRELEAKIRDMESKRKWNEENEWFRTPIPLLKSNKAYPENPEKWYLIEDDELDQIQATLENKEAEIKRLRGLLDGKAERPEVP